MPGGSEFCVLSATGIADPSGQIFANGAWQLVFKATANTPGPFTDTGPSGPANFTKIFGGNLDATGSFSILGGLVRSDVIAPAGSKWTLTVVPNANGQAYSVDLSLTANSVDCTAAINAVITNIVVQATTVAHAYKDSEVIPIPGSGGLYYDTTRKALKLFDSTTSSWLEFDPTSLDVLLNPVGDQIINQPVGTNLLVNRFENTRFADQFPGIDAGTKIAAAIADLPATGGIVNAQGFGATVQTISAQLDIGAVGKPVTLLINPNTRFQITTINNVNTDAIRIWNGSHVEGIGAGGVIGNGDQANFTVQSGCVVRSILANWPQDGTVEFFSAQNLTLRSNTGSTVAKGLVYLSGIFAGSYMRDIYTVFNGGGGSSLYITSPVAASLNITSDVTFHNCNWDGGAALAGGPAVTIFDGAVASGLSSINFVECQMQHPGNNQPILLINGNGSGQCGDFLFKGIHFETTSAAGTIGPYVALTDCHGVSFENVNTSGNAPTAGNAITISQTAANSTYGIKLSQWRQFGAVTNIISSSVAGIANLPFVAGPDGSMNIDSWSGLPQNIIYGGNIKVLGDSFVNRIKTSLGTPLTSGAFVLSAGWGTTATVSTIFGTDSGYDLIITSSGTGQAANPTVTLTFVNGAWGNNWVASITPVGVSTPFAPWVIQSVQSATMGLQFTGTPIAGNTYRVHVIVIGR